jgi:hypothetical protein
VVSTVEFDACLVVVIASVEVIESVDANVETGKVGVTPSFALVNVGTAEVDASLVVVIASVKVIESLDSNVARVVVVVVP